MAISKFDRPLRHFTGASYVSKIGGYKICFACLGANCVDSFLPALRVSPHNQDMNTKLSQFPGCRETDPAGSFGYEWCRRLACHVQFSMKWMKGGSMRVTPDLTKQRESCNPQLSNLSPANLDRLRKTLSALRPSSRNSTFPIAA